MLIESVNLAEALGLMPGMTMPGLTAGGLGGLAGIPGVLASSNVKAPRNRFAKICSTRNFASSKAMQMAVHPSPGAQSFAILPLPPKGGEGQNGRACKAGILKNPSYTFLLFSFYFSLAAAHVLRYAAAAASAAANAAALRGPLLTPVVFCCTGFSKVSAIRHFQNWFFAGLGTIKLCKAWQRRAQQLS